MRVRARESLSSIEVSSNGFLTIIVKVLLLLYVYDRDNEHDDHDDDEMLSLDVDTGLARLDNTVWITYAKR